MNEGDEENDSDGFWELFRNEQIKKNNVKKPKKEYITDDDVSDIEFGNTIEITSESE